MMIRLSHYQEQVDFQLPEAYPSDTYSASSLQVTGRVPLYLGRFSLPPYVSISFCDVLSANRK